MQNPNNPPAFEDSNTICEGCTVITPTGYSGMVIKVLDDLLCDVQSPQDKSISRFIISDLILERSKEAQS